MEVAKNIRSNIVQFRKDLDGFTTTGRTTLGNLPRIAQSLAIEEIASTAQHDPGGTQERSSGEVNAMPDWQEKYVDKLDKELTEAKQSARAVEERVSLMINQLIGEFRDRDNQRRLETADLHKEIHSLSDKVNENLKWSVGILISLLLGMAGIFFTVLTSK